MLPLSMDKTNAIVNVIRVTSVISRDTEAGVDGFLLFSLFPSLPANSLNISRGRLGAIKTK